MKPLTIERVKGQRQEFTFLGWKHDGLAFYAADPDGKPAVITPVSAYPDDSSSGEPYRFPRIVLLEIIPKQFEIGWSDYHRKVLKRWREAELAEVDAMAPASLFVFGAMHNPRPSRTPAEINQQRQERKMAVEFHFRMLMDIPLEELIFPIAPLTNYRLIDFSSGRWADEMGEDFRSMMSETMAFGKRWRSAYGVGQDYEADQSILRAMRSVQYVMRGDGKKDYHLTGISVRLPTDLEAQAYAQMQQCQGGDNLPKQIDDAANRAVATFAAAGEKLTKAGQQARAEVEAGAAMLGARVEDLAGTLGKFSEVFADPLVAAARDGSIDRKVPPEFAWWVFKERHFGKFPTVDGAYRSGLRPNLEKAGFAFSRATVHRWLTVIHEELEKRKLDSKRKKGRGPEIDRDFDVAQAKDTGPLPGDADEPPDDFVEWVQEKHAAGAMPSEDDVLDWLCARAGSSSLDSCNDDKLREIAKKWLKQAAKILGLDQTDPPEPDEDSDR